MNSFIQIRDLVTPYIITSRLTPSSNMLCFTDPNRSIDVVIKRRGEVCPLLEPEMQFLSEIAQNVAFRESLLLRGVCHATEDGETCTKCKDGDDKTCPVVQSFRRMIPVMLLGKYDSWNLVQIAVRPKVLSFVFENSKNYSTVTFDLPSSDCVGVAFEVSIDPYGNCPTIIRKGVAFLRRIGCLQRPTNYRLCFQDNGASVTERHQNTVHQWNIIDHPDFDPAKLTDDSSELPLTERPARYRAYVAVEECH